MLNKKFIIILASVVIIFFGVFSFAQSNTNSDSDNDKTAKDTTVPVIKLNGESSVSIEVGSAYTDVGATASDKEDGNLTDKIKITNPVDTSKLGIYTISYNVKDKAGNESATVTRTVKVIDTVKPVVNVNGEATVTIERGSTYLDAGATSSDNYDGNLTSKITVKSDVDTANIGTYTVTYSVSDASNNYAIATRTVKVIDTVSPTAKVSYDVTTLTNGNVMVTMTPSEPITVTNNGGLVNHVFTNNGSFTFEFADAAGNAGSVTATVNNIDKTAPDFTINYNTTSPTNADVKVTINANEPITIVSSNAWLKTNDITYTNVYPTNVTESVTVEDLAGNQTTKTITITNIDKVLPIAIVTYDKTELVSGSVRTTIVFSEPVQDGSVVAVPGSYTAGGIFTKVTNTIYYIDYWTNIGYSFNFTDLAGNVGIAGLLINNIDNTAPTFNVSSNPSDYTTNPVALTVSATDAGVGLAPQAYSFDNGVTWQASNTKVFNSNQIVNIKVRDAFNNVSNTNQYTISNIVITDQTFDNDIALSNSEASNAWYVDRYAPHSFTKELFDGSNRLKQTISSSDAQTVGFYNTQGRKLDIPNAKEISVDLYIPSDWALTNKRMAGVWGTGLDITNAVSAYPIIEFTSDGSNPRFRCYDTNTGDWIDLGLPSGFEYNKWYTLKIKLDTINHNFIYTVGNLTFTLHDENDTLNIGNVILQGHNTSSGVDYNIYWDNLIAKQ